MKLSLNFMHWIDRYVGSVLMTLLQPFNLRRYLSKPPDVKQVRPRRILIIKFWGIGSIALAGPTIAALRDQYGDAQIHFLTLKENEHFLNCFSEIDRVRSVDINAGAISVLFRLLKLLWSLSRGRYDIVVDLEFFTRFSALVTFITGARIRAGFHAWEVWRGNAHNIEVPFNRYWHVTRNFFNLGRAAGIDAAEPPEFRLQVTADNRAEAASVLAANRIAADETIVLINPNAGKLGLDRRWPPGNFAELALKLARTGVRPVFIGAPSETDYVAAIAVDAGESAVDLAGTLSIDALLALFERSAMLITNDSGPLHLAVTQDLPTLSFFGPETPVLYGPSAPHRIMYQELACSPCINVHSQKQIHCIYGRPLCLEQISVEAAFAEATAMLEEVAVHGGARRSESREPRLNSD